MPSSGTDKDALGQPTSSRRRWADGTAVAGQRFEYRYDDIGNRTNTLEGGNAAGAGLRTATYLPNALNQYASRTNATAADVLGAAAVGATLAVNGATPYRRGEYFRAELTVTNAAGPAVTPVSVAASAPSGTNITAGKLLHPPRVQTFAYDADGNLTNDLVWSYRWDAENRLVSMESTTSVPSADRRKVVWAYDPAGRRVRQTAQGWNGTTWTNATDLKLVYDGWACVAELDGAGTLLRQYVWGLDLSGTPTGAGGVGGLLWMRPAGGSAQYAAYDGNGNVVGLVDGATGMVSAVYEYDPYGNTIRVTGTGTVARDNAFRFSTKRAEETTGLVLYEYRVYSPSLGRWPNRDPIEEKGGANLYVLAHNDPIDQLDSLGLESVRCPAFKSQWPTSQARTVPFFNLIGKSTICLEARRACTTGCSAEYNTLNVDAGYCDLSRPQLKACFRLCLYDCELKWMQCMGTKHRHDKPQSVAD